MSKRKYLFFDIDGTLVVGGYGIEYVPESAKLALEKLRENGHFLAIATGRSYAMAETRMKELGFENMVSDGGNGVTINNQLLGIEPMDYEKCVALIDECKEKGYVWGFSPDNSAVRLVPDHRFDERCHDVYMRSKVVEGLDPRDYDQIFKIYIACEEPEEEKLDMLKELPWCRFQKEYLFVEPCDKAKGIRKIVDHFGGDYKDVFVFGDAKNDLSMFTDEWTSIAMGNAIPELKEKADYVTANAEDDGIYKACKHFGLIE